MSVLDDVAKKLAQTFMGLDDLLLLQELTGNGMQGAGEASRSLVGAAVAGGGLAARTATLGVQMGTKSARAAAGMMKDRVPGGEIAKRIADDVDRQVAETGQNASRLAAHAAGIHRRTTPRNPLTGEIWLEKQRGEGDDWNTLLADSAVDLGRMLAMPFTVGVSAGAAAAATPAGREVTRYSWNAVSSVADALSGHRGEGAGDRAEARAALLALGLSPLASATRDFVDVGEGLTRLAFGDGRKLKTALEQAIERLEVADPAPGDRDEDGFGLVRALRSRSRQVGHHTPESLLAASDEASGVVSSYSRHASAMVEDSGNLGSLMTMYLELLARLGVNGTHAVVNGWRDVDAIDEWVADDESARERDAGSGDRNGRPVAVEQLEAVAGAVGRLDDDVARSFFSRASLELARDTVYAYTERAANRDRALERVERLFGEAARDDVRDDCSLREEVRSAAGARNRLRALQDVAREFRRESLDDLLEARNHAQRRLGSLQDPRYSLENSLTPRCGERIEALHDFVALVDRGVALEGEPAGGEAARARVFSEMDAALTRLSRNPRAGAAAPTPAPAG